MFAFSSTMIRTASAPGRFRAALVRGGILLTSLVLAAPAFAQGGRLDQLFIRDSKGAVRQITGTVTASGLEKIVVDRGGKEATYENDRVDRIIWGEVSAAFQEGQTYFDRGDFENAAAKFDLAADEDEREVIQAYARLSAGEALMQLGTTDASQFSLALEQFDEFINSYPNSRELPRARALQARATLMSGGAGEASKASAKQAGELYQALFEEGTTEPATTGYDRLDCLKAGLAASQALMTAGETLPAREVLGVLTSTARTMLASSEEGSAERTELEALVAEAQLGEGFVLLASGQARQAETFFRAQLQNSKGGPAAQRFGALLGLGEAALAQGKEDSTKLREASLHFASVAGLDFTSRDRTARALLRLAETLSALGDSDASVQVRLRLQTLVEHYGDTPSAATARVLLEKL